MTAIDDNKLNTFTLDLNNHSAEGIDILASEPSRLISTTIYLLFALLVSALAWSFIGKSDVIISTQGTFIPDSKIRRVYAPLGGDLVDIYITEGMPINKGDVLLRIHAIQAIQYTQAYENAKLNLAEKEKEFKSFPDTKKLMELKAESLQQKHQTLKSIWEKREETIRVRLGETQKLALEKARNELRKTSLELNKARDEKNKFERLYKLPAHGGISKNQLNAKRNAFKSAQVNYRQAEGSIKELEMRFFKESRKEKESQLQSKIEIADAGLSYKKQLESIEDAEDKIKKALRAAQLEAESAARVSPDNIDEEGFLKILSPYSGIITEVPLTQVGGLIESKTPLASIASEDSKTILEIEIPESNRGLIREGLPVKLKVAAFSYQRYGFLSGMLDYVSPTTKISELTKKPYYKGRVRLDKNYFVSDGKKYPVRYGMTATAEIIVRQRRLIDFVLDPIRGLSD